MKNETALVLNYGPLKKDTFYRVESKGKDWTRIRGGGKLIYVGNHLLHKDLWGLKRRLKRRVVEEEFDEEESLLFKY